jgi:hypothetical protein
MPKIIVAMEKIKVIEEVKRLLDERLQVAWNAMEAAQESANDQSKSSMGDKYETSRSMGQLDRNMHARQYEQIRQERVMMERVAEEALERVAIGSLLQTTAGWFFICVSLGNIQIGSEKVIVVSTASPVGASLLGKKCGEQFTFLKVEQTIQKIH